MAHWKKEADIVRVTARCRYHDEVLVISGSSTMDLIQDLQRPQGYFYMDFSEFTCPKSPEDDVVESEKCQESWYWIVEGI